MNKPLLVRCLMQPQAAASLNMAEWDLLIRQARVSRLGARLAFELERADSLGTVPAQVRHHLDSICRVVAQQHRALEHELDHLADATAKLKLDIVLLKGGAYAAAKLESARGRSFSDIDILVPKDRLSEVEAALMLKGWVSTNRDAYDQRYYREWMHEIPPMTHMKRGTTLDVHHALTPPTSRICADSAKMLARARAVANRAGFCVLCPEDMVLHSATHLFLEGELDGGMRDLFDLRALIREFSDQEDGFLARLSARADEVGLSRPLAYALRYLGHMLGVTFDDDVNRWVSRHLPGIPPIGFMDALFERGLLPHHRSCRDTWTKPALLALYIRGHWLRMPFHLLALHLTRKAFKREEVREEEPQAAP